jgi:hypothetical protein
MLKIFTLSVAVAVIPLSQKNITADFSAKTGHEIPVFHFNFKNTVTQNIFEPKKKPTEAWNQNWMATAQENIRTSEYHFKWEEKLNAYCTPNRKNNLRFFYNDKGFSVEPRTTKIPIGDFDPMAMPDEIKYRSIPNWKIKFNPDKNQVGNGKWQIVNNQAEYITDKITVQYINNNEGMRQNFIVHKPLSKSDELKINFSIKTKLKTVLNSNRLQFFHKKTNVLNYEDLKVWDAAGKLLSSSFKKKGNGKYYFLVNAKDAVYPITIDPISTTPSAILESNQINANMGYAVSSAGDVNGDGYSDVIAGAHGYDNSQTDEGAAFIYHGSATGVSTTAAAFVESDVVGARLGLSVSTAGDVNGDGYSDIIVGAGLYTNGQANEGAAFIYHGSATGINTTAAIILESNQASAQMGLSNSVACAGDVNNDGYSDVIVGAWLYDNVEVNEGVAFVYHGSASGITGVIITTLEANQPAANYGLAVAGAGDVNGDGYSDVIVGAEDYDNGNNDEGVVFIYHGSAAGINNTAVTMAESNQDLSQYGYAVASAGDVNGDGYSDVIVGSYLFDNGEINEGAAFIYHGSAAGIVNTISATLESNQVAAQLGLSVSGAGDINGDGYSDVIAGANLYDNVETSEGAAFVYFGSSTGINTAAAILESNQANAQMGRGAGAAGDVNGDGYSDVIVGASAYTSGQAGEGGAFVFHGSAAGLSTTPNNTPDDADQANANFGVSVASAGDVNGDGYSDVIIGAWQYDDGANADEGRAFVYHGSDTGLSSTPNSTPDDADQASAGFGIRVASAGDVNGDGYNDVIIGATAYDDGANADEGRAFVYYGSATGLSAIPNSTPDDADQASVQFGISVASAGDVNGDGYSDVIIGAWRYDDGANSSEGRAFVYHGSVTGLSASPNSTPDDADQANAFFGRSVASTGDVNGDGYSDVIIGAHGYDDGANSSEGRAFVYHGSVAGLSATPNSSPDDADQAIAGFGFSVASAGDVNGDGYSDVIIGAFQYDDGANSSEGRAFVYHGSATGLSATPNSTPDDADQANAQFGFNVASAGDVNGDGYSEVIIGAYFYDDGANTDEGRAFVYHGSATGLSATPTSTPDDADLASARFGVSVAAGGDVNGDGYSDVIIGAYFYDDGANVDEGRAFVYNGNELSNNKRNNLRLYNTDLTSPINNSNFIFGNFGAGLYTKSFLGRDKGKLVWETRLNYNAYSGSPITNSTFFTAQQVAYTDMGLTGIEIKTLVNKLLGGRYTKLRARVKYDPVTAITGQVYSPWRNVSNIIDANNLGTLPIDLISFNAAWLQKGKTARLDFKTDKDSGTCCFDIEKSSDGFNFYSIGTLPAKNTRGIQSYSFIDGNATGKKQFYRIKIKGIAGQLDYSNIQQLQYDKAIEILVFPNPTTDELQLQLNKAYNKMNVQIFNAAGQLVKQMQIPASNQTITIPVQSLTNGKYWLHLQSGGEKQVLQFVKQ